VIEILVRCAHPRGRSAAARLRLRARRFLAALGRDGTELSLSLVRDAEIRALNRAWRGKDAATDVLSFPLTDPPAGPMLGDVVISLDTAARVAREEGRDLDAELDRYLAHGILHLLGHDHERARDAREMAEAEERLLSGRGLVTVARPAARRRPVGRRTARAVARGERPVR